MPHMANLPWMLVFSMILPSLLLIYQNISFIPSSPHSYQKSLSATSTKNWSW